MKYQTVRLRVNGEERDVAVKPFERLNDVLRATLLLTGTKRGCDTGGCGACTVIVGGRPIYSCMMPAIQAEGKEMVTIEGIARDGRKADPKSEAVGKATGTLRYTSDSFFPNMLYAKILRSPYAHARVKRIDTSKAQKLQGVKSVLTFKDGPQEPYGLDDLGVP